MDRILEKPVGKAAETGVPVQSRDKAADTRKSNDRENDQGNDDAELDMAEQAATEDAVASGTAVSETIIEPVVATETASSEAIEHTLSEPGDPTSAWSSTSVAYEQAGAEESSAISNAAQPLPGAGGNITNGGGPTEDEIILSSEIRKVVADAESKPVRQEPGAEQLPEPGLESGTLPKPADEATGKSGSESTDIQSGQFETDTAQNIPLPKNIKSLRGRALAAQDQANVNSETTDGARNENNPVPTAGTGNIPKPVLSFENAAPGNSSRTASEVAPAEPRIIEVEPLRAGNSDDAPVSAPASRGIEQAGLGNADDSKNQDGGTGDKKGSYSGRFASGIEETRFAPRAEFHPATTLEKSPEGELTPAARMNATDLPQATFDQMLTRTERLQEVIQRIDEHVLELTSGKGTSMTISLVPPNLGKLVLNCKESSEGISIQIVASSNQARQFLADREGMIREILANKSRDLAEFDVRTEDNNPGQRQFAQQQAKEEDEPTGRLSDIAEEPARFEERIDRTRENGGSGEGFWYVA